MLTPEYLHCHINALLRLSRDVEDPAMSAQLQEMADELRIMVSVADIAGLAADLTVMDVPAVRRAEVVPFRRQDRLAARHRGRSR